MSNTLFINTGLLLLRVATSGIMLSTHGWGKLISFSEKAATFPDPLGIGNAISLLSAVGAEFGCSLLVLLGLGTRIASLPLVFTMGVAAIMIHAEDPFQKKELAVLYGLCFAVLFFTGGGKYSMGHKFKSLSRWS